MLEDTNSLDVAQMTIVHLSIIAITWMKLDHRSEFAVRDISYAVG